MPPKHSSSARKKKTKKKPSPKEKAREAENFIIAWCEQELLSSRGLGCTEEERTSAIIRASSSSSLGVELHSHSHFSDGTLSPTELVQRAAERGVRVLSLTDHDTFHGLEEARDAGSQSGVSILPGVEISAYWEGDGTCGVNRDVGIHILGYFDAASWKGVPADLAACLASIREGRIQRLNGIIAHLKHRRIHILAEEVLQVAGPSVSPSRNHVAKLLVSKGVVADTREAFSSLLSDGCVSLGSGAEVKVESAIDLVRQAGGVPVLAHPWSVQSYGAMHLLGSLQAMGLEGVEVFRGSRKMIDYDACAKSLGLLRLGGSDYHAKGEKGEANLGDCPALLSEIAKLITYCRRAASERSGKNAEHLGNHG